MNNNDKFGKLSLKMYKYLQMISDQIQSNKKEKPLDVLWALDVLPFKILFEFTFTPFNFFSTLFKC